MIPVKAFIIRISSDISRQYAQTCAESCQKIGLEYEFFDGVENMRRYDAWMTTGLEIKQGSMDHKKNAKGVDPAACCSVSHALVWQRIRESGECAIILEHDALMLHPVTIDIPDGKIVTLGYKLKDPSRYNHTKAGPPKKVADIYYSHGAHAYAVTPKTAGMLLQELKDVGGGGPIDNRFFLRERTTRIPLAILDPTPAIGWIRRSTIWGKASDEIGPVIESFQRNLK